MAPSGCAARPPRGRKPQKRRLVVGAVGLRRRQHEDQIVIGHGLGGARVGRHVARDRRRERDAHLCQVVRLRARRGDDAGAGAEQRRGAPEMQSASAAPARPRPPSRRRERRDPADFVFLAADVEDVAGHLAEVVNLGAHAAVDVAGGVDVLDDAPERGKIRVLLRVVADAVGRAAALVDALVPLVERFERGVAGRGPGDRCPRQASGDGAEASADTG